MKHTERVFKALASPVRREILQHLKAGELAAGDIAARFDMAAPSVSRHLAILRAADLITERRDGSRILYRLEAEALALALNDFLSAVCPTQILSRRRGPAGSSDPSDPSDPSPLEERS
jgi:DNA-binding transcriptional ArsR family regulator